MSSAGQSVWILTIPVFSGHGDTLWGPQALSGVAGCKSFQCSTDSVTADLQTSSGIIIMTETVHWELHGVGFHG